MISAKKTRYPVADIYDFNTFLGIISKCIIKDEKRYDPEVSDTTMMTIAASLPGQQKNKQYKRKYFLWKRFI